MIALEYILMDKKILGAYFNSNEYLLKNSHIKAEALISWLVYPAIQTGSFSPPGQVWPAPFIEYRITSASDSQPV